jgi:hypothetical protein
MSWKYSRFTEGILPEKVDKVRRLIDSELFSFVFGSTTKTLMPTTDPVYSYRIRLSTGIASVKNSGYT